MEELQEPNAAYQGFTKLEAWQEAWKLKLLVRKFVKKLPELEKFRLAGQISEAAISIGSNIAEGHGRHTFKDQHHFCIMARGSLGETLNHMIDGYDEEYFS